MKKLLAFALPLFLLTSCAGMDSVKLDQILAQVQALVDLIPKPTPSPTPAPGPTPNPTPTPAPDPADPLIGKYFIVINPGTGKYSAAGRIDGSYGGGEYAGVIFCEWQAYESPAVRVKPEAHWKWYGSLAEARAYVDSHPETW